MCWDSQDNILIADAAANAIIKYSKSGQLSILHEFPVIPNTFTPFPPVIDYVPTCIINNPSGGFYVSNLTGFPFIPGLATIVKMDDQGNVSPFVKGLSVVGDIDIDSKGNLYALQLGAFDTAFQVLPFAAKIIKITPDGVATDYVTNFTPVLSSGVALDGQGGIYANDFALGNIYHITGLTAAKDLNGNSERVKASLTPNPTNTTTEIRIPVTKSGPVQLKVFDNQGTLVFSTTEQNQSTDFWKKSLDVSNWTSGLYYFKIIIGDQIIKAKFIKL